MGYCVTDEWVDFVAEEHQLPRLATGARELLTSQEVQGVVTAMKKHLIKVLLSAETQEEEHEIVNRLRAIDDLRRGLFKMASYKESK